MYRVYLIVSFILLSIPARAEPLDLASFSAEDGDVLVNNTNELVQGLTPVSGMPGDLNGDGIDDYSHAGVTLVDFAVGTDVFVVFGDADGFPFPLGLASLDGSNGFRITDTTEQFQAWVAMGPAGDVNNDGIADLVITAQDDQPSPTKRVGAVIFGREGDFPATLDVADLDSNNGFLLSDPNAEVSAPPAPRAMNQPADINCDGIDDLVIGFPQTGPGGEVRVLFGGQFTLGANVDLSGFDGDNGTLIQAPVDAVDFGFALSGLGDFNGDGCDDLAIGDPNASALVKGGSGRVTIVFGDNNLGSPLAAGDFDGSDGLHIESGPPDLAVNALGLDVAGGDFDGDGLADLLAGAPGGTSNGGQSEEGGAIMVLGAATNPARLEVTHAGGGRVSATRGFFSKLTSSNPGEVAPFVAVNDFNADGFADAAFAAPQESSEPGRANGGVVYVVFGQDGGLPNQIPLDTLAQNTSVGFVVTAAEALDNLGKAIAGGDFNNDGSAELAIGGDRVQFPAESDTGAVFWIRGTNSDIIFGDQFEG